MLPPSPDLRRPTTPAGPASQSPWIRRRCPARQLPAAATRADGIHQALRLDRLPGFTRIEEFEEHLASFLSSGIWVYFDGADAWLRFGPTPPHPLDGLRIELGLEGRTPSRLHVLGPGADATFAIADGAFLAGAADRRRIDLVRYWYQYAKPHLLRVWSVARPAERPAGPVGEARSA